MPYLRVSIFLAVLCTVLFAGLNPEPVPQLFNQQDKLHHLLGFAALTFSMRLAFARGRFLWLALASLAAALLIELGQGFLPQRSASLGDMLANTLGVMLGWAAWRVAQQLSRSRPSAAAPSQASVSNG